MATKIRLSVAVGDYEIIRALKEGAVEADGLELVVLTGHGPRERHWRMARNQEFDVCEFNVGGYLMSRDHGDPLAAIPVFLHRRFRHGFAFVNVNSGIKSPKDLIGQRVGGTNFQPAGNIWLRGIFEQHYGVPHRSITWVVDRSEDVPFTPPPGLKIEMIPAGKSMDTMLAEGEIPAMINPYIPQPMVDGDNRVARLFPDYKTVEREYFQQTGIFPIMHVTVMKQEIVDKYPWARSVWSKPSRRPRISPTNGWRIRASRRSLGSEPNTRRNARSSALIRGSTDWAKPIEKISKPSSATVTSRD